MATAQQHKPSPTHKKVTGETVELPVSGEQPWHTLSLDSVKSNLKTDSTQGLSQGEAAKRLEQYGPNTLEQAKGRSVFAILIAQFKSVIVALLVAATGIAFAMGDRVEAIVILIVIVLNAAIGFFTEWRAEQALTALQKQSVKSAHVVRDGAQHEIDASELVPGDLVILSEGNRVPADGRVIESVQLQIEEAALTGESLAVTKTADPIPDASVTLGDRLNLAFLSTTITAGRGQMLVTATGAKSEVGKIGALIDEAKNRETPLEQSLAKLGQLLIIVVLVLCAVIVGAGMLRGVANLLQMLEMGLSLAIAAVPEGLPAVTTMTLALGMQRMAKMRALVRRLPAVETLGSVTVICTDKTGTLTRNQMTVSVFKLDQRSIDVTGTGYEPEGEFKESDKSLDSKPDEPLNLALRIGILCNDAKVERANGETKILGDPTEAALIVAGEKAGLDPAALATEYPRLSEVPFSSENKQMITVHRTPEGKSVAFVKGAPGSLLDASQSVDRKYWDAQNEELAKAALRVLALAYRELPESYREDEIARDLTFVGLVGMRDPLREEAKTAIATCHEAGIRSVMITGDQQVTAAEIARQLGIDKDFDGKPLRIVHGSELENLDAEGWKRTVADAAVFARVSPEHKLRIVEAFQAQNHVVAMTGDGVNDAPALKQSDIGIAMGIQGTEVAKESADIVITDDNFATIVSAVEQGRIIYSNILRFLHYLLSCNLSEILTVFVALMVGWPLPLVALQVLWLNLITDIFPAFALALETSAPDVMKRAPRDPDKPLITTRFVGLITWQAFLLAGVTLVAFAIGLRWYGSTGAGLRHANTLAFMTLALAQVFHAFNARSQDQSAFTRRLFSNGWLWAAVLTCVALQIAAVYVPLLQKVLQTAPPKPADWWLIFLCSLAPIVIVECVKLISAVIQKLKSAGTSNDKQV